MKEKIDRSRRRTLKATAGLGAFGLAGLSSGTAMGSTSDEIVSFSGHEHVARGNATLDATADFLVASGLENDGEDGVRTLLDGVETATTIHDPISLGNTGDSLTISTRGTYGGVEGVPVGTFALTNQGDRVGIDMGTGDVNAGSIRVGVYVDGFRVATIDMDYGDWWFWRNGFSGGGWNSFGVSGGSNPGFGVSFDERVAFQTAEGDELDGDAYVFEAMDTAQPVEGLSSVETRANVGDVTIRDIQSQ